MSRFYAVVIVCAVAVLIGVIFYTGYTVHEHNNQLTCMKAGFDQVLNELLNGAKITAPPNC